MEVHNLKRLQWRSTKHFITTNCSYLYLKPVPQLSTFSLKALQSLVCLQLFGAANNANNVF